LEGSKEETQKFDGDRFNLRKLNELEVRKRYQIDIRNSYVALGNVSDDKDIHRAGAKSVSKPELKILSLHALKQHKPWFDKECISF
jgi:hypothetical protein